MRALNTERDSLIFFENDLEVFIDGIDSYDEIPTREAGSKVERSIWGRKGSAL